MVLSHKTRTGLTFNVRNPEKVGPDRIANAVAAYELYNCPVAVADFGTATTVSVVGKGAVFLGGAIMPGIGLMNESLAQAPHCFFRYLSGPRGRLWKGYDIEYSVGLILRYSRRCREDYRGNRERERI